jgi:hypothetical protein
MPSIVRRRMADGAVESATVRSVLLLLGVFALAIAAYAYRPWESAPPIREPTGAYVPSGPDGRALIWAVGDGADGSARAQRVVTRMRRKRFDRFLYLGDVYGSGFLSTLRGDGTKTDYRKRYAPVYGDFAAKTAPTPGNHEWPQRGDGYEPYWADVFGETPPAYYDFRVAGWQILSLNSEAPHGSGSAQVRWLRTRVTAPGSCPWRSGTGRASTRASTATSRTSRRCGTRCAATRRSSSAATTTTCSASGRSTG